MNLRKGKTKKHENKQNTIKPNKTKKGCASSHGHPLPINPKTKKTKKGRASSARKSVTNNCENQKNKKEAHELRTKIRYH